MLMTRCTPLFSNHACYLLAKKKDKRSITTIITSSNRRNVSQESKSQGFKLSTTLVAQSAIAVFALGFIDAGYSGDWSRIGVISKENEDLLKATAFLVVPSCIFLIFSFTKRSHDSTSI